MEIEIPLDEPENHIPMKPMTLTETLKAHYMDRKAELRVKNQTKISLRILLAWQAPTQLYMFLQYIVPYLFFEYDWPVQYFLKVLCVYICSMGVANYICTILYQTQVHKGRDRPSVELKNRWEAQPEHFLPRYDIHDRSENRASDFKNDFGKEFDWTFCDKCAIYIPPRAHHCDVCNTCILKRDHHCYMVGTCIGFWNQRYFAVLTFYAVICGGAGGYFTYKYLASLYYPVCQSWMDFIPPVALYKWVMGTAPHLSFHMVIMIAQVYLEFLFGFAGFIYFSSQMTIIGSGVTLYELAKQINVKNINGVNDRFRSVFGGFWALNFIFPMQIILRQHEDGTKWDGVQIDYNANTKNS